MSFIWFQYETASVHTASELVAPAPNQGARDQLLESQQLSIPSRLSSPSHPVPFSPVHFCVLWLLQLRPEVPTCLPFLSFSPRAAHLGSRQNDSLINRNNPNNRTPQALPTSTAASLIHRDLSQASFDSLHATSSLFSPLAGVGWGMWDELMCPKSSSSSLAEPEGLNYSSWAYRSVR